MDRASIPPALECARLSADADRTDPAGAVTDDAVEQLRHGLRTPRSAAVAGIAFSALLGTFYVLIRISIPADPTAGEGWLETNRGTVTFALSLVPFAGIAFLWFIGVVRDRLGDLEDRFFATVLFGSGLLFLAMTFAATAIGGGMVATYELQPTGMVDSGLYSFSRNTMYRIANVFAIRMASVFMISMGTMGLRTRTMPRALAVVTYAMALVLMVSVSYSLWIVLVFPVWVLIVSVYILVGNLRTSAGAAVPGS